MVEPSEKTAYDNGSGENSEMNGTVLEWRCHPATRKPLVTTGVTTLILVTGILVFFATASKAFGLIATLVMFASLAKFYFPTFYRLTDEKIMVKTTTQTLHKEWSIYRSYYPDKNGVLLSPFVRPSRLENFRGLYIMFNKNREEVIEFVKTHIAAPAKVTAKDIKEENQ